VDCKGLASIAIGNCLAEIVYKNQLGCPTHQATMDLLNERLDRFYDGTKCDCKIPYLLLSNITDTQRPAQTYPQLAGPGIKAANTRHLVPWVLALVIEVDDGSEASRHRIALMRYLNEFIETIYENPEFLAPAVSKRLKFVMLGFLRRSAWLSANAVRLGLCRWQLKPKHHYFHHLALLTYGRNPRFYQTYIDESFVGKLCRVYKSSQAGAYHETIQREVLTKYLFALSIHFSNTADAG